MLVMGIWNVVGGMMGGHGKVVMVVVRGIVLALFRFFGGSFLFR
jgi:hypothetical protein